MKKTGQLLLIIAFAFLTLPGTGSAQAPAPGDIDDGWSFIVAPYLQLANITGDAAVGRAGPAEVQVDTGDILENLKFGAMGHFEARRGRIGVLVDFAYVKLGADSTVRTGGVLDAEVEELELEAFLTYRFGLGQGWLDAYAGARYWDIDIDVTFTGPSFSGAISRGETWVDPVIGARVIQYLAKDVFVTFRGDVGGFGVNSDLTWNVQGGIGYDVASWVSLILQYRALGVDFENDKKGTPGFFAFDTITHGPLLGAAFKF